MLKAYFDDSNMDAGKVAVLAGWLAEGSTWKEFSFEWERVLRMSPRIRYFKWKEWRSRAGEFAGIGETNRNEKINLLIDVLSHHDPVAISSVTSNRLHLEIFGHNPDRILRNPYFLSFYSIVAQTVEFASKRFGLVPIDFRFDIQPHQMETAAASWDRMREVAPPQMKSMLGNVSFHNDVEVLPLQAADLNAGWTREQAERACFGLEVPDPPWGHRGDSLMSITRTWTADLYNELANRTGAFTLPS